MYGAAWGAPRLSAIVVDALDRARLAGGEAAVHGVGAGGLDAVDGAVRLEPLDRRRDAGAEPAAADRHDDRVEPGHLLAELEPESGGPRTVRSPRKGG